MDQLQFFPNINEFPSVTIKCLELTPRGVFVLKKEDYETYCL